MQDVISKMGTGHDRSNKTWNSQRKMVNRYNQEVALCQKPLKTFDHPQGGQDWQDPENSAETLPNAKSLPVATPPAMKTEHGFVWKQGHPLSTAVFHHHFPKKHGLQWVNGQHLADTTTFLNP